MAVEGVNKVADASPSSKSCIEMKDDFKLDVGAVVNKVLVEGRLPIEIRQDHMPASPLRARRGDRGRGRSGRGRSRSGRGRKVLLHTGVLAGGVGGRLDLGIRNQSGRWPLVVKLWKMVWGEKARTRALFDLEVVALRVDLGSGRGAVPDGIGFVVVLGALHGWPKVLDRVVVLDVAEAFVVSMVP